MAQPRKERLTFEQANMIRAKAHELGLHSIALAQAFQFEAMLRIANDPDVKSDATIGELKELQPEIVARRWE